MWDGSQTQIKQMLNRIKLDYEVDILKIIRMEVRMPKPNKNSNFIKIKLKNKKKKMLLHLIIYV